MKKRLVLAVLLVLVAATVFAFDPDELNLITFVNSTGTKIEMIFLSPGDSKLWGPDLVGADYVVNDGASVSYYVHYPDASFTFDIMATDDKGNKFELRDYRISDGKEGRVRITRDSLDSAAPDFKLLTLEVENNTGRELVYLFVSPSDSDAWGCDMLDSETTLIDGDTHSIVIPVGKEAVTYNLMAADEDNNEYQFDVKIDPRKGDTLTVSIEPQDLKRE
ncbi:MAG TPA: hypothetical protein VHE79_02315 [Spirochaetia bacterium]